MNLTQGYSSGGSQNSGWSNSYSNSASGTDAMSAREWSAQQAEIAWNREMEAMQKQMSYNAEEAQKERDWQQAMANTIYTRSAKNMTEAGINPILAYSMGLSGAGVGSGATASLGGVPSAPMAQSFMDTWSAGNAMSQAQNQGTSWNSSENGLITALSALGGFIDSALGAISSGMNIDFSLSGLEDLFGFKGEDEPIVKEAQRLKNDVTDSVSGMLEKITGDTLSKSGNKGGPNPITGQYMQGGNYNGTGGGHGFSKKWKSYSK